MATPKSRAQALRDATDDEARVEAESLHDLRRQATLDAAPLLTMQWLASALVEAGALQLAPGESVVDIVIGGDSFVVSVVQSAPVQLVAAQVDMARVQHASRSISIPPVLAERFAAILNALSEALCDFLVPNSGLTFTFDGSLITYRAAQHHLQALARTAGLPPFGWHTLRHTFASQLARRGATIQGIQTLLGHTTINMSLRYAHLSPDFLHATIALLNAANMREPAQVGQPVGSAGSVDTAHAAVLHA